ncbi:hypothetical protein FGIG_04312 [Fasciola gigantica]|uniref:Secreted protein n=1 Tax=Fasciola gigantica TaxID=46835 RepID=A0A504YNH1_FASGI|nr:hypothetical protein FGIG_04312 [Fasciola gigantica]
MRVVQPTALLILWLVCYESFGRRKRGSAVHVWMSNKWNARLQYCRHIWWKYVLQCPDKVPVQNVLFLQRIPWRPVIKKEKGH